MELEKRYHIEVKIGKPKKSKGKQRKLEENMLKAIDELGVENYIKQKDNIDDKGFVDFTHFDCKVIEKFETKVIKRSSKKKFAKRDQRKLEEKMLREIEELGPENYIEAEPKSEADNEDQYLCYVDFVEIPADDTKKAADCKNNATATLTAQLKRLQIKASKSRRQQSKREEEISKRLEAFSTDNYKGKEPLNETDDEVELLNVGDLVEFSQDNNWKIPTHFKTELPTKLSVEELLSEAVRLEHCLVQVTPSKLKLLAFQQSQRHHCSPPPADFHQNALEACLLKRFKKNSELNRYGEAAAAGKQMQKNRKIFTKKEVSKYSHQKKSVENNLNSFDKASELKFSNQTKAQSRWQTDDEICRPEQQSLLRDMQGALSMGQFKKSMNLLMKYKNAVLK